MRQEEEGGGWREEGGGRRREEGGGRREEGGGRSAFCGQLCVRSSANVQTSKSTYNHLVIRYN